MLDAKLGTAIRKILVGEAGDRVLMKSTVMEGIGLRIRGRQLLHALYQEFQLESSAQAAHSLTDIIKIAPPKIEMLAGFMNTWYLIIKT